MPSTLMRTMCPTWACERPLRYERPSDLRRPQRRRPAEVGVELAARHQRLDAGDPLEARPGEVLELQAVLLEGPVELLDPPRHGPAQPQAGRRGQLAAVHPVAAQVRARALGEGHLAAA